MSECGAEIAGAGSGVLDLDERAQLAVGAQRGSGADRGAIPIGDDEPWVRTTRAPSPTATSVRNGVRTDAVLRPPIWVRPSWCPGE